MLLGRVIGTLTPCVVYEGLEGVPMLWIQPLDKQGNPKGETLVACDATRMAGFAVSKAVGGAVVRNRVKRRLRAIMAAILSTLPEGARVVVRALPGSATATFGELDAEVRGAVGQALAKVSA